MVFYTGRYIQEFMKGDVCTYVGIVTTSTGRNCRYAQGHVGLELQNIRRV